MDNLGEFMSFSELEEHIIGSADTEGDGRLSFIEFAAMLGVSRDAADWARRGAAAAAKDLGT